MADVKQYVTFGVTDDLFATPVEKVREILDLQPISRLPRSPRELLGMINVRGQGVPVVELRGLLGLAASDETTHTRIVVVKVEKRGKELAIGLKTDRVFEVTALDSDDLDTPPEIGGDWADGAIIGVGRRNGAFVSVIDVSQLIVSLDFSASQERPDEADAA